jgi:hypothetical protein
MQEAVVAAADSWCQVADVTGWCPEVIVAPFGDALVTSGHWDTEVSMAPDGAAYGAWAENDRATRITISANMVESGLVDAETWTGAIKHEFGHFGIYAPAHRRQSPLMRDRHESATDYPDIPDSVALDMWCSQQGC